MNLDESMHSPFTIGDFQNNRKYLENDSIVKLNDTEMDNDWSFTNEDEVDQEELEVALYSQIHFDTATENIPAITPNKDTTDLNFVRPSFQVKVKNFIRKKTEKSAVQKVESNKAPVYNLDFISLSTSVVDNEEYDNDDDQDRNNQEEDSALVSDQSTVTSGCPQDAPKCECDTGNNPSTQCDDEVRSPEGKKSAPILDHSIIVISDGENDNKEDETNLPTKSESDQTATICDSDVDNDNDEISQKENPIAPTLECQKIVICDGDSGESGSEDEERSVPSTVVLKYHQDSDSDSCDESVNDKVDSGQLPTEKSSQQQESERVSDDGHKAGLLSKDKFVQGSPNHNEESDSEQEEIQNSQDEEDTEDENDDDCDDLSHTRHEMSGEKDMESHDGNFKRETETLITNPLSADDSGKKWTLDEKDRLACKTPVNRYFNPNTVRCRNCNEEGHLALFCTKEKKVVCIFCGDQGHRHLECPQAICFKCCTPGHKPADCVDGKRNRYIECYRCWLKGHIGKACPDLWRQYHRTIGLDSTRIVKAKCEQNQRVYCYNCGQEGHLGHECDHQRMSLYIYSSYPFVAEYDKGKIRKNQHRKREDYNDAHSDNYDRKARYINFEDDYYHRRQDYDDRRDRNPHRHGRYEERQDDGYDRRNRYRQKEDSNRYSNSHRKEKHSERQGGSSNRKEKYRDKEYEGDRNDRYRETRDDRSNRRRQHTNKQDDRFHRKENQRECQDDSYQRHGEKQDNNSQRKRERKEKSEDNSNKRKQIQQIKDTTSCRKQEDTERKGDASNKKEKCKTKQNTTSHTTNKNSENQLGHGAGKKRKAEEPEAAERSVSKRFREDTTFEDLRIQVNRNATTKSVTVSSENSAQSKKKNKKNKKDKGNKNSSEALKVEQPPKTFVSGTSQFTYQEPTSSKYTEDAPPPMNESSALNRFSNNRFDMLYGNEDSLDNYMMSEEPLNLDFMIEDGEIIDSSDGALIEMSRKPSSKRRKKSNKRRTSPVSFIGLMD